MRFLGQQPCTGLPGLGFTLRPLTCIPQAPCPLFLPGPLIQGSSLVQPRLHSANPINKELRKFIRKPAVYRFR